MLPFSGGLSGLLGDNIELIGHTVADGGPGQSSGVHAGVVARLSLGRVALSLLHAQEEWPRVQGLSPHLSQVTSQVVLHT